MSTKGQHHSLTFVQGHSFFIIFKHFFQRAERSQISCGASIGKGKLEFVQLVQVTWPRWPPCPYMVKPLKIFFFGTHWPMSMKLGKQHWACTKFVQMMSLGWPLTFLCKGQVWFLISICMGKGWNGGLLRNCWSLWYYKNFPSDAKQWSRVMDFLSAPNNHDRFFFMHTFWSPAFDFNIRVAFKESRSCMWMSAILKLT